jgi:hypothetical protein
LLLVTEPGSVAFVDRPLAIDACSSKNSARSASCDFRKWRWGVVAAIPVDAATSLAVLPRGQST